MRAPRPVLCIGIDEVDDIDDDDDAENPCLIGMGDCCVINTSKAHDSLKTRGVSTCIAICASGTNDDNQTILGMYHCYTSGITDDESARSALNELTDKMNQNGVTSPSLRIVGGTYSEDEESPTDQVKELLLALSNEFNIKETELNVSNGDNDESASVLLTSDGVTFSLH